MDNPANIYMSSRGRCHQDGGASTNAWRRREGCYFLNVNRDVRLKTRPVRASGARYRHPLFFREFLFLCPRTRAQDQGEISVEYTARGVSVDPESFVTYLLSFQGTEIHREAVVNRILDDMIN